MNKEEQKWFKILSKREKEVERRRLDEEKSSKSEKEVEQRRLNEEKLSRKQES